VFGEALQTAYERLKKNIADRETDLDQDIKVNPAYVHISYKLFA